MIKKQEIKTAKITSVTLGKGDRGVMSFGLMLNIQDGRRAVYGGYVLDEWVPELGKRVPTQAGCECITTIMDVVGVDEWSKLVEQPIRIVDEGLGKPIITIGNLLDNKWFNIEEFFENKKTEDK